MYVYIRSEPTLWTVGFYRPDGFEAESDHGSSEEAAERVAWLNGSQGEARSTSQCTDDKDAFEAYKERVIAATPPKKFITFNE